MKRRNGTKVHFVYISKIHTSIESRMVVGLDCVMSGHGVLPKQMLRKYTTLCRSTP